jgi:geranylgeranyl diphosphate synthase type II
VLAGDALLTQAFELLSRAETWPRYRMGALLKELAVCAGSRWLIAGQVADLEGEGKRASARQLRFIHESKTAALLTTSIRFGAMSANADERKLRALTQFGKSLGLAFQIIDDILDVTQTSAKLGKSAGKDVAASKSTYPSVLGLDRSRREARRLTDRAHSSLTLFGRKAAHLHALADYLLDRDY